MKIELSKILKIKEEHLKKIGEVIIREIISDAQEGVMQNNTSGHRYKSKAYTKYKANSMRRFSADKIKTYHSKEFGASRKLKGYANRSTNTETSFVNLTLTGDMFKNLKVDKIHPIGVEIGWVDGNASNIGGMSGNVAKVLGNKNRGYDVVGLNEKNQEMALYLFAKYIDDNLKNLFKEETIIRIG